MAYQVKIALAVVNHGESGTPGYFYEDAVIPDGYNDERCKVLVEEGILGEFDPESVPEAPPGQPAKSASKADWEAYARSQGAEDDELDGLTKDDIIANYGG